MSNEVLSRSALIGFCGKVLGTLTAFVSAAIDVWRAWDAAKEGDYSMAVVFGLTSVGGAVVAWIFASTLTAGVGFVVLLVSAAPSLLAQWVIGLFRDNEVEKWLQKTPFGVGSERFDSLESQKQAWQSLLPQESK